MCDVKERYLLTHLCGNTLTKIVYESKNGGKTQNGDSNSYEVVSNLGVGGRRSLTYTLVRDNRLSSKLLKRNELPKKILTKLRKYK